MKPQKPTQTQIYYQLYNNPSGVAGGNSVLMKLLFGKQPISDGELKALVEKHPNEYGEFAKYIGMRKGMGMI